MMLQFYPNGAAAEAAGGGVIRDVQIDPPPVDGGTSVRNGVRSRVCSGAAHANL
jgi:hypothetical protein